MTREIKKIGVLGSGVMGAQIAGHFANAGLEVLLLDRAPGELTEEEKKKGLSLQCPEVRNRFSQAGIQALKKANPAPLYLPELADRVQLGNFEDDLERLKETDWIIEAVIEDRSIKQDLLKKVDCIRAPGTLVSTNTSGLSVSDLANGMSQDFRSCWFGSHFFNPVRYMKLLELIPTPETRTEIIDRAREFGDRMLGKGVILCSDTPNFVANRIGIFDGMLRFKLLQEYNFTMEEVDAISGKLIGRPKPGRSADMIGLDTVVHVARNLYENVPDDPHRELFQVPDFILKLVQMGRLGDKTGQGIYRKIDKPEGSEIEVTDFDSLSYRPRRKVEFPCLELGQSIDNLGQRLRRLVYETEPACRFLWSLISETLLYSAARIPHTAPDILTVDRAMRWGYNWKLGPFETWDAIGLEQSIDRLQSEGRAIPEPVLKMLSSGHTCFYQHKNGTTCFYDFTSGQYKPVPESPGVLVLSSLKQQQDRVIRKNADASLVDIGDAVLLVEFHSKMNAISDQTREMLDTALEIADKDFQGIVIGNQGEHFSAGANLFFLLMAIEFQYWKEIEQGVKAFQDANMKLKYFHKPVVCAVHGLALGGGCEVPLHAHRVQAAAETYTGLVEVGVGLVPAGGGTKEFLLRNLAGVPAAADAFPFVRRAFETVAMAKVARSALEAMQLGLLRSCDGISIHSDRLLADAKRQVLSMANNTIRRRSPRSDIPVLGEPAMATLKLGIHHMLQGGYISEYDAHLARKLAYIMTGGDLPHGGRVSEQHLLDLEREVFLSLCGEQKTIERIKHVLKTNKPLRN